MSQLVFGSVHPTTSNFWFDLGLLSQLSMTSLRSASRSLRALIRDSRITRAPSCTKSASSSTRTFHNYTKFGYASSSTSAHPSGAGSWTEPTAYDLVPIVIEQSVGAPYSYGDVIVFDISAL